MQNVAANHLICAQARPEAQHASRGLTQTTDYTNRLLKRWKKSTNESMKDSKSTKSTGLRNGLHASIVLMRSYATMTMEPPTPRASSGIMPLYIPFRPSFCNTFLAQSKEDL